MFEPLFTPLFSSLLSPLIDPAQRIFITLDSAQQGRYLIQNPVTYGGTSVTISFDLILTQSPEVQYIFDGDMSGVNRFWALINSDQSLVMAVPFTGTRDGVSVDLGVAGAVLDDGALHRYTLTFTTTLTIGRIGSRFNIFETFGNIIANVDLGNGNAWPLDVLTGNTQQAVNGNNEITLVNIPEGAPDRELFTKNTSTDPDQWENADKSRIIQIA